MKYLVSLLFASSLLAVSPAWAHHGHGHSKHWDKHAEKAWKHERKAWEKQQKHLAKHGYYRDDVVYYDHQPAPRVITRYEYVEPAPVYTARPGIFFQF
jgi:hypothetical protein